MIDGYTGHLNYCVPPDDLALGTPPGTQGLCESEGHRVRAIHGNCDSVVVATA